MSDKIQTRIFQYGDENEGSWPPQFGTGDTTPTYINSKGEYCVGYPPRESKLTGAPYVAKDEMLDGVKSQTGSGKIYYSKSALRKEYKSMGFIEVGNDWEHLTKERSQRKLPPNYEKQLERDVGEAIEQVRYNQAPLNEFDRERCKIINKQIENSLDTRVREDARK